MICCDLDGVLGDFCKSACRLFGKEHIESERKIGCVSDYIGVSINKFWREIDLAGEDFWANIEPYPYFDDIVKLISKYDNNFIVLTSPSKHPTSYSGKKLWMNKYLKRNEVVCCPAKLKYRFLYNSILIDDNLDTIKIVKEKNMSGTLFLQTWNTESSFPIHGANQLLDLDRMLYEFHK